MNSNKDKADAGRTAKGSICLRTILVILFGLFSVWAIPAFAQDNAQVHSKLAKELRALELAAADSSQRVRVIIQFKHGADVSSLTRLQAQGAKFHRKLQVINSLVVTVPAAALPVLESWPDVLYVTPDRTVKQSSDSTEGAVLADVAAIYYWVDGSGVGVAVVDSGVTDHPDLHTRNQSKSRVVYSENLIDGSADTSDGYGHGTHVAGILGGNGASSNGQYSGVAPNANIINLKVLDANGAGTDSTVIGAIQRAIQLKAAYNIRMLNLSLGRQVYESYTLDPLCQAVEAAWQAGITVVVAAGNGGRDNSMNTNGYATIAAPGNDPMVITVGATNAHGTWWRTDDTMTSFSSKGPSLIDHIVKPDLVAPGNHVVSLLAKGSTLDSLNPAGEVQPWCSGTMSCSYSGGYFQISGTSMATPVVSGAAALMLQKNPNLTPDQVKARMMKTAWKGLPQFSSLNVGGTVYVEEADIFTLGAGYLDFFAAMGNTDVADAPAYSPTAVYNAATQTVTLVNTTLNGSSVVWGESVAWDPSVVWGGGAVDANSVVWGESVVWDGNVSALSVVWGESVTWGDSIDGQTALTIMENGDN